MKKGFTLIETVVAMGVFSLLTVTTSLLLFGTLRGSKKAAAALAVRTEGANVLNSMTQALRFADEIIEPTPGSDPTAEITSSFIKFKPFVGDATIFECLGNQGDGSIASHSATLPFPSPRPRITSDKVAISSCNIFKYTPSTKTISIDFTLGTKSGGSPILDEVQNVQFKTQVVLRN